MQLSYRMPAEWEEHSACLILFPHNPDTFRVEKASKQILDLALSIATVGQEAVYFLCKNSKSSEDVLARLRILLLERGVDLSGSMPICTAICPSNDTWVRDTGPTFVFRRTTEDQQQQNELIGLDWDFNAYGGPEEGCYWPCTDDRKIARLVCSETTLAQSVIDLGRNARDSCDVKSTASIAESLSISESLSIPVILEGGSFHTDGEGTLLTTSECLLNPNRNPHLTKEAIEAVLKDSLGVSRVLWLPHGLDADDDTNGHVDNFCCFVRPGHVVLAWTDHDDYDDDDNDNDDGTLKINNYSRCREAYEYLQSVRDARGRKVEITKLYLPSPSLRYTEEEALSLGNKENDEEQEDQSSNKEDDDDDESNVFLRYPEERMAASYVNFYIANKAILVPQFADAAAAARDSGDVDRDTNALAETDRMALETLRPLFPDRTVVGIPSREILLGGGNIHCQTQQVPSI